jgi:hypothetical protein
MLEPPGAAPVKTWKVSSAASDQPTADIFRAFCGQCVTSVSKRGLLNNHSALSSNGMQKLGELILLYR